MTEATTEWQWWQGAVKAFAAGTMAEYFAANPISDGDAHSGFYETRSKSRKTGAITRSVTAYWREAGKLFCRDGRNLMIDEQRAVERFPYAAKRPIPHPTYKFWIETGAFPDEHEAAHRDRQADNGAPADDSLDSITARVEDLAREADKAIILGAATSIEASNRAADLADRLRKLEVRADDLRKAEKKPHDDKAKAVDREWTPIRDRAAEAKDRLKKLVITPFEVAERKRQEQATAAAVQTGEPAPAPVRRTAGTASRVALRTVKNAEVTDYVTTLAYFANHAEVKAVVQALADRAARAGIEVPGVKINEQQVAA